MDTLKMVVLAMTKDQLQVQQMNIQISQKMMKMKIANHEVSVADVYEAHLISINSFNGVSQSCDSRLQRSDAILQCATLIY
ncbi:MAG: hypothetical protein EZS28_005136 [Streblomastix strix]|uniref:Uncharacterized protein n=1 Tax=Streblomastix strix TaxID=222440 RepID=A0A5J4WYC7_9EUKA|nr:MAG: hypothetical protein EZS28_005136 [Streblomastix strix]